ncbi:MAG: long-chain fatty acid--CoA ligase [bacterium]
MGKFKETSMAAVFQNQAVKYGDRACVSYKKDGEYTDISWSEMNRMVRDLACYLMSIGVKKGDRIGLFSENRYEWWVADLAILSVGAVNVPIYATNSAEEAEYVLKNSESKICFVSTDDHLARLLKAKKKLPKLGKILAFDESKQKKKDVVFIDEAYKTGQAYKQKANFEKRISAIKPDDLATIIYTSGTTGNPKGVMLSHKNFISNVNNTLDGGVREYITEKDIFLSFLPLSHSLERTCGEYAAIAVGATTAFAEDVSTLMENFQEVRPTIIISVPRIYEKVHTGILAKVADAPAIRRSIFNFAMSAAKKNLPYVCRDKTPGGLTGLHIRIAEKLVFSKLKATLGMDRMTFAISGGGPLSTADAEFFIGMGIKILEGFGLSETTPIVTYNRPDHIKPGTVGAPIPQTDVKISDEGEVLIKGPQVMKGYYKNPKATRETFTKDGYFRSGDIGMLDEDNYLSITGRLKDIIVTSGGKNISPQNIENSVKNSKYVEQIAIIGDNRKYLSALIIPAFEEGLKWAKKQGLPVRNNEDLVKSEEFNRLMAAELDKHTKQFARVEQIRKFKLLNAEWTQESGELTPTQKIKRRIVSEKYSDEIEEMYPVDED